MSSNTGIYIGVALAIIVLKIIILTMICMRRRQRRRMARTSQVVTITTEFQPNINNLPNAHYQTGPYQIYQQQQQQTNNPPPAVSTDHISYPVSSYPHQTQQELYAVPLDLLPRNFRFDTPGVQYKGDHVLVNDLSLVQIASKDEYLKPSPYNPNFSGGGHY